MARPRLKATKAAGIAILLAGLVVASPPRGSTRGPGATGRAGALRHDRGYPANIAPPRTRGAPAPLDSLSIHRPRRYDRYDRGALGWRLAAGSVERSLRGSGRE